jgi:hypothetical protein
MFMNAQITEPKQWWSYEGQYSAGWLPVEYVGPRKSDLERFLDEPLSYAEVVHGYGARLSANGYLDCTEWCVFDTEHAAAEYLADTYDLCPQCLEELDEEYARRAKE